MTTLDGIANGTPNSPTPLFPSSPSPDKQVSIHPQVEGAPVGPAQATHEPRATMNGFKR